LTPPNGATNVMLHMTKKTLLLPFAAALSLFGCRHQAPVVAGLEVQPHVVSLAYPQLATVHLTWTPNAGAAGETPSEPLVFVHLLDAKHQVLRTFDHPFPQHWAAGTPIAYDVKLFLSALAPPIDPGRYHLTIGLFDPSGKRWALSGLGEPVGRDEYQAAEVDVQPQPAGPHVAFSDAWQPLEAGSDKQVVAHRWLADQPGEIRVDTIPGPGTLWLSFRIAAGDGAGEKLTLHDPGSNSPAAVVRDTCGGVETGISGTGRHDVEMPVDGPGAGGVCVITLTPNFHVVTANHPERTRSVAVDNVAWIPGAAHGASPAGDPASPAPPAPLAPPAPTPPAPPNTGGH
jgi:hypothetical protein